METNVQRLSAEPRALHETTRNPGRRAGTPDFQSALEGRAARDERGERDSAHEPGLELAPERATPARATSTHEDGEPGSLLDVVG